MRVIVVTTENKLSIQDLQTEDMRKIVGGDLEVVRPFLLSKLESGQGFCMLVNEEGRLIGLPQNALGCLLYGTIMHGEPIVGNIIISKTVGPDFADLTLEEIRRLSKTFLGLEFIEKEVSTDE